MVPRSSNELVSLQRSVSFLPPEEGSLKKTSQWGKTACSSDWTKELPAKIWPESGMYHSGSCFCGGFSGVSVAFQGFLLGGFVYFYFSNCWGGLSQITNTYF